MFHGYFYIESLSLTIAQKQTLVDTLKAWGLKNDSIYPHERNHWRIRPDNNAVIFEAVFDDTLLTAANMKTRLVNLLNVTANQVTYATTQTKYGSLVTYSYNAAPALRLGVFGGLIATLQESREATWTFLADDKVAWGDTDV